MPTTEDNLAELDVPEGLELNLGSDDDSPPAEYLELNRPKVDDTQNNSKQQTLEAPAEPVAAKDDVPRKSPPVTEPLPRIPPHDIPSAQGYQVRANGNNLELVTPWGKRYLFGDQGLMNRRDYKLEIPLDALRPPEPGPTPSEEKAARMEEKKDELTQQTADRSPQSLSPRVTVEHDFTARLILEANRLYNRGQFYEATLAVDQVLSQRPDIFRAWAMKGSLLYVQGFRDLARGAWEKAMELDPNNPEVKHYLSRLQ